jgi:hypothetical protein
MNEFWSNPLRAEVAVFPVAAPRAALTALLVALLIAFVVMVFRDVHGY